MLTIGLLLPYGCKERLPKPKGDKQIFDCFIDGRTFVAGRNRSGGMGMSYDAWGDTSSPVWLSNLWGYEPDSPNCLHMNMGYFHREGTYRMGTAPSCLHPTCIDSRSRYAYLTYNGRTFTSDSTLPYDVVVHTFRPGTSWEFYVTFSGRLRHAASGQVVNITKGRYYFKGSE